MRIGWALIAALTLPSCREAPLPTAREMARDDFGCSCLLESRCAPVPDRLPGRLEVRALTCRWDNVWHTQASCGFERRYAFDDMLSVRGRLVALAEPWERRQAKLAWQKGRGWCVPSHP